MAAAKPLSSLMNAVQYPPRTPAGSRGSIGRDPKIQFRRRITFATVASTRPPFCADFRTGEASMRRDSSAVIASRHRFDVILVSPPTRLRLRALS